MMQWNAYSIYLPKDRENNVYNGIPHVSSTQKEPENSPKKMDDTLRYSRTIRILNSKENEKTTTTSNKIDESL